ncbi:unnamed protein product, partial [Prorocentrum cordatum]
RNLSRVAVAILALAVIEFCLIAAPEPEAKGPQPEAENTLLLQTFTGKASSGHAIRDSARPPAVALCVPIFMYLSAKSSSAKSASKAATKGPPTPPLRPRRGRVGGGSTSDSPRSEESAPAAPRQQPRQARAAPPSRRPMHAEAARTGAAGARAGAGPSHLPPGLQLPELDVAVDFGGAAEGPRVADSAAHGALLRLHAAAKVGDAAAAEAIASNLMAKGSQMPVVGYGALISAYAKAGDAMGAERWLNELIQMGVAKPNTICVNITISAHAKNAGGRLPARRAVAAQDAEARRRVRRHELQRRHRRLRPCGQPRPGGEVAADHVGVFCQAERRQLLLGHPRVRQGRGHAPGRGLA